MRACRRAGLAAPEVLVDDDGARLGTAGLGDGPRRRARRSRAGSCATTSTRPRASTSSTTSAGSSPACTPSIPPKYRARSTPTPSRSRGPHTSNSTTSARRSRRATNGCAPTGPPRTATTIVHGDLRLGNVIVDEHGLAAAIDWELVHVGDPARGPRLAVRQGVAVRRAARGRPASARSTSSSPRTKRRAAGRSTATRCTGGWSRRP